MGLFLLADGTHAGFDHHRARFFWEGQGNKRKYYFVKWQELCKPRNQGGLGIANTKLMNIALMLKWIWKLFTEQDTSSIWIKLIRAKYPEADDIFGANTQGASQFWQSLHKIKHFFKMGAKFHLGHGEPIRFWLDWWVGEAPLCTSYPRLFEICEDPEALVAQVLLPTGCRIIFRRNFGEEEMSQ